MHLVTYIAARHGRTRFN